MPQKEISTVSKRQRKYNYRLTINKAQNKKVNKLKLKLKLNKATKKKKKETFN